MQIVETLYLTTDDLSPRGESLPIEKISPNHVRRDILDTVHWTPIVLITHRGATKVLKNGSGVFPAPFGEVFPS